MTAESLTIDGIRASAQQTDEARPTTVTGTGTRTGRVTRCGRSRTILAPGRDVMESLLADVQSLAPIMAARDAADPESYPVENVADLVRAGVLVSPFPASLGGRDARLPE